MEGFTRGLVLRLGLNYLLCLIFFLTWLSFVGSMLGELIVALMIGAVGVPGDRSTVVTTSTEYLAAGPWGSRPARLSNGFMHRAKRLKETWTRML